MTSSAWLLDGRAAGILAAGMILASGLALGRRALSPWRAAFPGRLAFAVFAAGVGLGLLGALVWILGTAGLLSPWLFRALLLAGTGLAGVEAWRLRRDVAQARLDPLDLAQAGAAALLILPMAAGMLAMPTDYDTLEYHLGAPAEYLRRGRVAFLEDNAFAAFPEQQEMLYLAGLAATGSHGGGAAAAKGVNLGCWLLAASALLAWGRRLGSARAGGWAALALLASPWTHLTAGWMVYNEPGLACFALLGAWAAWEGKPFLCGLMAGMAFAVKYPAALFVLLPLGSALAWGGLRRREAGPAVSFSLGALLPAAPWLLRNLAATGNPVYPLLGGILPSPFVEPVRFAAAHAPGPSDLPHLAMALGDLGSGMLVAPALLVFLLFGWDRGAPGRLLRSALIAWCAGGALLWFLLTHRVDRFCLPLLPALCLAVGLGVEGMARLPGGRIGRGVFFAVLAFAAAGTLLQAAGGLRGAGGAWEEALVRQTREAGATYCAAAVRELNRLPAGSRVLFIGEAETFYLRLDGSVRAAAPTVFNDKPFEQALAGGRAADGTVDWAAVAAGLRRRGFTHLYVNWPELARLQATYGDRRRGYSAFLTSRPDEAPGPSDNFFDRLEAAGLARRLWQEGGGRWRILAL